MESQDPGSPRKKRRLLPPEGRPYVVRNVLDDIPLTSSDKFNITCVEYWTGNLYIGTSTSEILHLVSLPPAENDINQNPTYILASRLEPSGHGIPSGTGVSKILVLPGPMKACVLCNGVVSFYTLPELSPAFPNRELTGVQWIGGIDENEDKTNPEGPVVMLANARKVLLARVGERLRSLRTNIEYPGCLVSCRRGPIACVADSQSYTLLETEHQQKIPLFPISSVNTHTDGQESIENNSDSLKSPPTHSRSISLGNVPLPNNENPGSVTLQGVEETGSRSQLASPSKQMESRRSEDSILRVATRPRSSTEALPTRNQTDASSSGTGLQPHIISPFPSEFMLVTGTTISEPGVGMFVNLDGDVVRGTIEFSTYPDDVNIAIFGTNEAGSEVEEGSQRLVALLNSTDEGKGLEIQNFPGSTQDHQRFWLPLGSDSADSSPTLHQTLTVHNHSFTDVANLLKSVPLRSNDRRIDTDPRTSSAVQHLEQENALFESQSSLLPDVQISNEVIEKRAAEEIKFARRFGQSGTRSFVCCGERLLQILENPLILQLESHLTYPNRDRGLHDWDVRSTYEFLDSIQRREPKDETEFVSLNYVKQKASLILFLHLQYHLNSGDEIQDLSRIAEAKLHEGGLDPRVVLLLLPPLASEALQGAEGIWLNQGIVEIATNFKSPVSSFQKVPIEFWLMIRHYLTLWQEKRGYGSIADEKYVFDSVDTALLHVLLYLDQTLPAGSGVQTACRAKLENIVDHWKGDFARAVIILEQYDRLFILSRLYQSKKLAKDVLSTWKRIVEGEKDVDYGSNPEQIEIQVRRYLVKLRDASLVEDYTIWLAKRNSTLAMQVFSDESSRVKFSPQQVIEMLQNNAPGAVQQYLEHLVFTKGIQKYADDLVVYYLDSVLSVLENSQQARDSLAQSYSTYRALESPKPTYLNFITDNAPKETWWQSRLRLLQLLGSGGYAASNTDRQLKYSVDMVLERLAPFSSFLVSESIIIDARRGRHKEALRLLTHGLGDYDTAIRYCYFGSPSNSQVVEASDLPPRAMQQELFESLFHEFLRIDDVEECLERTSQLLGKFATWFNPSTILSNIPDDWTVETLSEFLLRSFRSATSEKNEAVIIKALSAAQNLQKQADFIDICEKLGAKVDAQLDVAEDGPGPTVVT